MSQRTYTILSLLNESVISITRSLLESKTPHEEASDPQTPKDRLAELSDHDDVDVLNAVAENPNTPPHALGKLFWHPHEFKKQVLNNPARVLHQLEDPNENYIRKSAPLDKSGDHPLEKHLMTSKDQEMLHFFHNDPHEGVRSSVAKNKNISPDLLHQMVQNEKSPIVKAHGFSYNKSLSPSQVHHIISTDPRPHAVIQNFFKHPSLSQETIHHATQSLADEHNELNDTDEYHKDSLPNGDLNDQSKTMNHHYATQIRRHAPNLPEESKKILDTIFPNAQYSW